MATNKHFEIDLQRLIVNEIDPPTLDELLRLSELPSLRNPFGTILKNGKFVSDDGVKWFLENGIVDFNFQKSRYMNEISFFTIDFSFDAPLSVSDLNTEKFLYSIGRNVCKSGWRYNRHGLSAFFQIGQVESGSIKGKLYIGILATGSFVASYPALKQGFNELLVDTQFVAEQISTAIRAAKTPSTDPEHQTPETPEIVANIERRRREANRTILRGH